MQLQDLSKKWQEESLSMREGIRMSEKKKQQIEERRKIKEKRTRLMRAYAIIAEECDRKNDIVGRRQAADDWRELATDKEAKEAPKYLTWKGRKK